MTIGESDQRCVAVRIGRLGRVLERGAGGVHRRRGVSVFVGVDTDDDVDNLCQHGHCVLL
jgi:hypothetical protein